MKKELVPKEKKQPTFGYSLFAVLLSFSIIMVPAVFLGAKTQPLFLIAWMVAIPLSMHLGYTYKEIQANMIKFVTRASVPMFIALSVGATVGMWNASGTMPMITKYGLMLINPKYFMVTAFFICLVFSLFTGTSFGTCGTAGVALMGVGLSMGLDPLKVAAPIIGAAFFGDAISPLSDSTNMAAATCETDLFETVKYQATSTIPAILISAAIYFVWGLSTHTGSADVSSLQEVIAGIDASYKMSIINLLPLVVVLVMLIMHVPSVPSILSGAITGFLVAWLYQGYTFKQVVGFMWSGFSLQSENAFISTIFSRGGISGMAGTVFLYVFAFGLFGILSVSGIIDTVAEPLTRKCKTRLSGMICTVILGFIANITSASGNFSFVFTGNLMMPVYEKNGLNKWDLTRAMSVGCLLTGLLVPWNSNPLTTCGFLGVEPLDMLRYAFTPIVTFLVILFYSVTNVDKKFSKHARNEM